MPPSLGVGDPTRVESGICSGDFPWLPDPTGASPVRERHVGWGTVSTTPHLSAGSRREEPRDGVRRGVVSFVRRSPRMNASQHHAMQQCASEYLIDVPRNELSTSVRTGTHVDLAEAFGRDAPLVVEIGSGVGDSLVAMAGARPGNNVLAFEVYAPAIASTLGKLNRANVHNVRLVAADGTEGLRELIGEAQLSELWTFFPDPWPKKRHHKRRLVQPQFARLVSSRLIDGGLWWLATDWASYAEQMREVCDATDGLVNEHADRPGGWAPRPDRPVTRFEQRGLNAGRVVRDLSYRRLERR